MKKKSAMPYFPAQPTKNLPSSILNDDVATKNIMPVNFHAFTTEPEDDAMAMSGSPATVGDGASSVPVAMGMVKEIEVARQFSVSLPSNFEGSVELLLDSVLAVLNISRCALVLYTGTAEEPLLVAQAQVGRPLRMEPLALLTDTILKDLLGSPQHLLQKQLTLGGDWYGCLAIPIATEKRQLAPDTDNLNWELALVCRYLSPLIPQVLQLRNIHQLNQLQAALEEVSRFLVGALVAHEAIENMGKVFSQYLDVESVFYLVKNTETLAWEAEKLQGIETLIGEKHPCSEAFSSLMLRYEASLSHRTTGVMPLSAQQVYHYCSSILQPQRQVEEGLLVPIYLDCLNMEQEPSLQGVFLLVRYESTQETAHAREWSERTLHFLEQSADLLSQALTRAALFEKTLTLASCDELTGLLNRRAFYHRFEQELDRSLRTARPLSVVIVDVDYFKHFNDTYGHLTGDKVLRSLANLLQTQVRRSDVVCRFGGEEFVFLLPETSETEAFELVDRIRQLVAEKLEIFSEDEQQALHVTMSAGISTTLPVVEPVAGALLTTNLLQEKIKQLLEQADVRLYQAKNAGRNCVVGSN